MWCSGELAFAAIFSKTVERRIQPVVTMGRKIGGERQFAATFVTITDSLIVEVFFLMRVAGDDLRQGTSARRMPFQ